MRFGVLQAHRGHAIKWFSLGLIYLRDEIAEYIGHDEENIGNYSTITYIGKYREYRTTGRPVKLNPATSDLGHC